MRRFPPPWTVEKSPQGGVVVLDSRGKQVAIIYSSTEDEARRIAVNIAKLPDLSRS